MAPTDANYSVEFVQLSRELARIRDQKMRAEKLLEEAKFRNQRLIEKASDGDGIVLRKCNEIRDLNNRIVELELKLNESKIRENHAQQRVAELEGEVAHRALKISDLCQNISELEGQLALQSAELEELKQGQSKQHDKIPSHQHAQQEIPNEIKLLSRQKLDPEPVKLPAAMTNHNPPLQHTRAWPVFAVPRPNGIPATSFYIGDEDSSKTLMEMQGRVLQALQAPSSCKETPQASPQPSPRVTMPSPRVTMPSPRADMVSAQPRRRPGTEFDDVFSAFRQKNPGLGSLLSNNPPEQQLQ